MHITLQEGKERYSIVYDKIADQWISLHHLQDDMTRTFKVDKDLHAVFNATLGKLMEGVPK